MSGNLLFFEYPQIKRTMTFPIVTLIALSGTALLAFLTGVHIQRQQLRTLAARCKALTTRLKAQSSELSRLTAEHDASQISVKNLKGLLQDYEQKIMELQSEKLTVKPHNGNGNKVNGERMPKPVEVVREVEVIREIPVLVFEDKKQETAKEQKVSRLINAFKKGVEMESRRGGASRN
jgi:hypothetical protein